MRSARQQLGIPLLCNLIIQGTTLSSSNGSISTRSGVSASSNTSVQSFMSGVQSFTSSGKLTYYNPVLISQCADTTVRLKIKNLEAFKEILLQMPLDAKQIEDMYDMDLQTWVLLDTIQYILENGPQQNNNIQEVLEFIEFVKQLHASEKTIYLTTFVLDLYLERGMSRVTLLFKNSGELEFIRWMIGNRKLEYYHIKRTLDFLVHSQSKWSTDLLDFDLHRKKVAYPQELKRLRMYSADVPARRYKKMIYPEVKLSVQKDTGCRFQ